MRCTVAGVVWLDLWVMQAAAYCSVHAVFQVETASVLCTAVWPTWCGWLCARHVAEYSSCCWHRKQCSMVAICCPVFCAAVAVTPCSAACRAAICHLLYSALPFVNGPLLLKGTCRLAPVTASSVAQYYFCLWFYRGCTVCRWLILYRRSLS